jgi:hypothetical protein
MKFLKQFIEFINESRYGGDEVDRLSHEFERRLDETGSFNDTVVSTILNLDSQIIALTQNRQYWYNRESRNISKDHYAINVKFYAYPDLEEFQEAIGPGMEVDDDDLENEWLRWIQMEIEDFESLFLEQYPTFSKISWGGRSGGWLCPIPDNSPDDMIYELREQIDDYIREFEDLDEDDLQQLQDYMQFSDEERARLGDLGLINEELIQRLLTFRAELIGEIERKTEELDSHEEALKFIITKHEAFAKNAKETFLEYVRESQ